MYTLNATEIRILIDALWHLDFKGITLTPEERELKRALESALNEHERNF